MSKIFIYAPNNLKNSKPLYGYIQSQIDETSIYIITDTTHKNLQYLGHVGDTQIPEPDTFVQLYLKNEQYELGTVKINKITTQNQIFIKYNKLLFQKSRLLTQSEHRFQTLAKLIQSYDSDTSEEAYQNGTHLECLFFTSTLYFTILLNRIIQLCKILEPMIKYSSIGTHLVGWLERIQLITSTLTTGHLDLKTRNLIISISFDILCGYILVYYVSYLKEPATSLIMRIVDSAVSNLRELLQWLMGSPVGLKLNNSFNVLLGHFFLYHINLWWTFLMVGAPLVQLLHSLLWLGPMGLTFVTAVLADLIALGTFHVYCIYVYASR